MHNLIRILALVAVLLGTAAQAVAATATDFYTGLLRRGMASYEVGRYPDAAKQLRIAAFGLVEFVDQYQLAQIHLALACDKLGDAERAREAAHRVVVAERIQRKYTGLPLTSAVRTAFEVVAVRLLSPTESALLLKAGTSAPALVPPPATPRRTTAAPPRTTTTPPGTASSPQTTAPVAPQPRSTIPEPQATTPENTAPQSITPALQPEKPKSVPPASQTVKLPPSTSQPQQPIKPPQTPRAIAQPAPTKVAGGDANGRAGPVETVRPPVPAPPPRTLAASEVTTRLAAAERALKTADLIEARRAYRELLAAAGLDHETLIRVAEGLYRARDFLGVLNAFTRIGTLRRGEEPYRYYIAVALYETGEYTQAKKELAAALPFIEITPDVARYRTKIEGSM